MPERPGAGHSESRFCHPLTSVQMIQPPPSTDGMVIRNWPSHQHVWHRYEARLQCWIIFCSNPPSASPIAAQPIRSRSYRTVHSNGRMQLPALDSTLRPYHPKPSPVKRLPSLRDILGDWVPKHSQTNGTNIRRYLMSRNDAPYRHRT